MQLFIDLDLREAIVGPGDRTPIGAQEASSQDTLELDIYYVQGAGYKNPGPGVALKAGLFQAGQTSPPALALQTGFIQQPPDSNGNVFYQGLLDLNTAEMAAAMTNITTSLACVVELRYQLADGEIIHTIHFSVNVFPALLAETGTPPPVVQNTYPDASTLLVTSMKGAPGGVAALDGNGLVEPAEIPVDGQTVLFNTDGKLSVPIDQISLTLQGGKLAVNVDGQTIVINNGALESGLVLTTFKAAWTTPAANASVDVQVNDSTKLKINQEILTPLAGYYTIQTITDINNITIVNSGDPFNVALGTNIIEGAVILPAQLLASGSSGGGTITLGIGSVTTLTPGSPATASITGTAPNLQLNLGIPAGHDGTAINLTIGSVSTLAAGAAATAGITGTFPNLLLNLGIPQGQAGGGTGSGGGLASISDVDTTPGDLDIIYDGASGKLKGLRFDPAYNATDNGLYLNIPFPAYARIQQSFTMPAVGANTGFINAQNQGGTFLQPGFLIYIASGGLFSVVATQTVSGQDQVNLQNVGSQQGFTNAAPGATVLNNSWVEIVQQVVSQLTDATTDASAFSLIAASTGQIKLINIPSWLNPVDTGTEIQIQAGSPAGVGDMTKAAYDTLSTPSAIPTSQVDQSRILVMPSLAMLRNFVDNGDFRICQRAGSTGTTTFATAAGFQIDRWQLVSSGAGVFSLGYVENNAGSLLAGFPGGPPTFYSAKLTVTTASTPGVSDFYVFQHVMEAIDCAELENVSSSYYGGMCLHFYLNSSITGILSVVINDQLAGDFFLHNVTIAAANTWQEVTIVIPAGTNRTRAMYGQKGWAVQFVLGAGTNKLSATALNTWGASSINAYYGNSAAPPTNFVATSGAILQLAQIGLNGGRQPMVKFGNMRDQLARCQRFLDKSYDYATAPGAITTNGQIGFQNQGAAQSAAQGWCPFAVKMYSDPTVTIYDPTTGASGAARCVLGSAQATGITAAAIGDRGFGQINSSASNLAQPSAVFFHYLASCEI